MKKAILASLAVLAIVIIIFGIMSVISLRKYHDENTFADIEVVIKERALDPYEEEYMEKAFSDTCLKGSVMELEPKDYTISIMKITHDGLVDVKIHSRGGLVSNGVEYKNNDVISLKEGETVQFLEEVTDMEFIIEVTIANVYYR